MSNGFNAEQTAQALGATDVRSTAECLEQLNAFGLPADLMSMFCDQLRVMLPEFPDRDRILANLTRFLSESRSPQSCLSLFEREPDALKTLLRLVSTSQFMADILISTPDTFDLVRLTDGQPVDGQLLREELAAEIQSTSGESSVLRLLRDYRRRETLRIAYGDFINQQPVDTVIEQLSDLAEAIVHAAVIAAQRELSRRFTQPTHPDGRPVRFSVLSLGKLGGRELNYSSDIDLIFVRESLDAAPVWKKDSTGEHQADEYFQRLGQLIVRFLSESTSLGICYRVDLRLRPHGRQGPLVVSNREAIAYYDSAGRTWERQAFIKTRPVAGDLGLGSELLDEITPWIYRRYLMRADITGIAALKRRIEQRARRAGDDDRNVKLGHGGIRDIEYVIQFLQLLHGADQPLVRCTGTLDAIRRLQSAGCLTAEEQSILSDNYRFLRGVEHHLQIMFDRQTHTLPRDEEDFNNVARRIARGKPPNETSARDLRHQLATRTGQNRRILDHLLHDAFSELDYDENSLEFAESDLILDPEPSEEVITATLEPYGFSDCKAAYRHLQDLAVETIAFLSTRRSRHFLAAISPQLLAAISNTPNPDATLISLANVAASLGGKAVLWELFSSNPPSMDLCVRLCATSPYLATLLTSNPGMIDELLDSLMVGHLPNHTELSESLEELCRGAIDIAPILHSFKNSMHLRVGVRDILGKNSIAETHTALSDIAETCMEQVIHHEFHRLVHQLGVPVFQSEPRSEQSAELVVLAVGKLGGREPNYHSDLDVIFLFDGEGQTKSLVPNRRFEPTTNRHFFNQLCQRVIQAVTQIGSTGRLYDLDVRLRPLGRSGQLAITIDDLQNYFSDGHGQVWERQALCKARPIWGSPAARNHAMQCVLNVLTDTPWKEDAARQIYDHRMQLQEGAAIGNLKRGIGGTMDVEFVVQLLQLMHVNSHPEVIRPGTLEAIRALQTAGVLDPTTGKELHENYQFLRSIESGIRLMNLSARHELPTDHAELEHLAFLLRSENRSSLDADELAAKCRQVQEDCRKIFESTFGRWLPAEDQTPPETPAD